MLCMCCMCSCSMCLPCMAVNWILGHGKAERTPWSHEAIFVLSYISPSFSHSLSSGFFSSCPPLFSSPLVSCHFFPPPTLRNISHASYSSISQLSQFTLSAFLGNVLDTSHIFSLNSSSSLIVIFSLRLCHCSPSAS